MTSAPQAPQPAASPRPPRPDVAPERRTAPDEALYVDASGTIQRPTAQPVRRMRPARTRPPRPSAAERHGRYRLTLELSLVLSLLVVIGVVRMPMDWRHEMAITVGEQEVVQMEEIITTKQIVKPPPPPRPPVPVEVPNNTVLEDDIDLNLDATLDFDAPVAELPPPPPVEEADAEVTDAPEAEIFVVVESMPVLIGGMEGIAAKVEYPDIAQRAGLEGRVIVQFVVDEEGYVRDAMILRGQVPSLDEEALRVVRMARFEPGRQRGKAVKVRMTIPITFRLLNEE